MVVLHYPLSSSPEIGLPGTSRSSAMYSIAPNKEVLWSTIDLLTWKLSNTDNHLLQKKEEFIKGYSNVILAAAHEFNISPVLLAAVSWREFGGDPMWIDDLAYSIRQIDHVSDFFSEEMSVTRPVLETSFGNVSIQVRRAAAILGYDPETLSGKDARLIAALLKDPVCNLFIAAHHLSDLSKIDFPEKEMTDLTDDDLKITATRFYRGPELTLDQIKADTRYGENVLKRFELLNSLLAD